MASLPPSSAHPRRRAPQHGDTSADSQTSSSPTNRQGSRSAPSPDTPQTLYLNDIPSFSTEAQSSRTSTTASTTTNDRQPVSQPTTVSEESEPRKCWICFSDETEDDPMSSQWRSPCPCALTAHESCLLDWIADLQAPGSRKRTNPGQKILCPQCKSEIHIQRPRSILVDVVNALDRAAGRVVIPGIIGALSGCIWTGCMVFGINTVHVIFGMEDANELLPGAGCALTMYKALNPFVPFPTGWGWRLRFGLPLIPVVLVLSRSNIADSVLPILPIVFFATQSSEHERLDLSTWPPSAAMTLAALPYLRGFYNEVYERTFGEAERKWMKEIQPRNGESGDDAAVADRNAEWAEHDAGGGGEDEGEEDVIMQVNVEVDVDLFNDNEENEENDREPPAAIPPVPVAQGAGDGGAQQPVPQQPQRARQNNLVISTTRLADTILGALLFPTASAAMGVLLKLVLPKSWTAPPSPELGPLGRKGLLQARWGRSIIGGCLFVVLKDALVLYTKYRRAQQHRERRVVDYKGSKGKRNKGH